MLNLFIEQHQEYDEDQDLFIDIPSITIQMENSLLAISKWESIWKKPFLDNRNERTRSEIISYAKCMTITQNVPDNVFKYMTDSDIRKINSYLEEKHTATWFKEDKHSHGHHISSETATSELIYYWMITYGVPFTCEKWNIERLMTLIRICMVKSNGEKKMSQREILEQNRALNAARRKKK